MNKTEVGQKVMIEHVKPDRDELVRIAPLHKVLEHYRNELSLTLCERLSTGGTVFVTKELLKGKPVGVRLTPLF